MQPRRKTRQLPQHTKKIQNWGRRADLSSLPPDDSGSRRPRAERPGDAPALAHRCHSRTNASHDASEAVEVVGRLRRRRAPFPPLLRRRLGMYAEALRRVQARRAQGRLRLPRDVGPRGAELGRARRRCLLRRRRGDGRRGQGAGGRVLGRPGPIGAEEAQGAGGQGQGQGPDGRESLGPRAGAARAARAAGREAGETGENRFIVARAERRLGQDLRLAGRAPSRLRRRRAPRLPGPRGHRRPRRGSRITGQGAPPRRHAVRAHPRRPAHDDVLRAFLRVPGGFAAAPMVPIRPSLSGNGIRF